MNRLHVTITALILIFLAGFAIAEPRTYQIDIQNSRVVYTFEARGKPQSGVIPFQSGTVVVDISNLSSFTGRAELLAKNAKVKPAIFAPALHGKSMLHTKAHPTMIFFARTATRGALTMKGVTQDIAISVQKLNDTTIALNGQINRFDFGVNGFPELVGPTFKLQAQLKLIPTQ